ncbi:MAG: bifunctional phosphoribosylaminoimidazolecarboxamide formyltransferase/IMP cyclohydrolase [Candidatus Omnitrophota bacterium]
MIKIKRALVSVSNKEGIVELCLALVKAGVEIISTGGTAKTLKENNIPVIEISDYTGFPEILDGRVKTLHPKVHAGILARRDNPGHMQKIKELGLGLIDMVVINLYPFEETLAKPGANEEEAIENIDIGGPGMLRSAAKNHASVVVVSSAAQYPQIIRELECNSGAINEGIAKKFARRVFELTSRYDAAIAEYLGNKELQQEILPEALSLGFIKIQDLRYGENPHQKAAFYKQICGSGGLPDLKQLHGKELSFNNLLDLNSAWNLVREFDDPAAVIIKHNNPCGVAQAECLAEAYKDAFKSDSLSAFGGIVGLNQEVDLKVAKAIFASGFLECIIAPSFSEEALEILSSKKNLRILKLENSESGDKYDIKKIEGGLLLQDKDSLMIDESSFKLVTKKKPTRKQALSLIFAWKVAKHVKSNAIVLAKDTRTVGIGAGQTSRVDSVVLAGNKAGHLSKNSCLASDGFFPKPDSIIVAAKAGIKAIIQPGGSIADKEVISACDKHKIAMVFTGVRHFKH